MLYFRDLDYIDANAEDILPFQYYEHVDKCLNGIECIEGFEPHFVCRLLEDDNAWPAPVDNLSFSIN